MIRITPFQKAPSDRAKTQRTRGPSLGRAARRVRAQIRITPSSKPTTKKEPRRSGPEGPSGKSPRRVRAHRFTSKPTTKKEPKTQRTRGALAREGPPAGQGTQIRQNTHNPPEHNAQAPKTHTPRRFSVATPSSLRVPTAAGGGRAGTSTFSIFPPLPSCTHRHRCDRYPVCKVWRCRTHQIEMYLRSRNPHGSGSAPHSRTLGRPVRYDIGGFRNFAY
jgi:hypothetical protein